MTAEAPPPLSLPLPLDQPRCALCGVLISHQAADGKWTHGVETLDAEHAAMPAPTPPSTRPV